MKRHILVTSAFLTAAAVFAPAPGRNYDEAAIPGLLVQACAAADAAPIDIERAKQLFRKRQSGETLTPEEQAYLDRARQEVQRRQQQGGGKSQPGRPGRNMGPVPPARSSTGLIPLTDLGTNKYKGEHGGLYGGGSNEPPAEHRAAVEKQLKLIQPRDADGNPASDGKIVFLSVGMSNTTMEFQVFKRKADADPKKSPQVVIVDGAQGARVASVWARGASQPSSNDPSSSAPAKRGFPGPAKQKPMPKAEWLDPDHGTPNGTQYKTFQSKVLGREVSYLIYLPPGYEQEKKRYPVIYWLHGMGGNQRGGAMMFVPHVEAAIQEGVLLC